MTGILDQVADARPRISFRPATARQLFILRLAHKLGEPAAVEHYAELARSHSDETLLLAYRHALNHGHPPRDRARGFHEELASTKEQEDKAQTDTLLAIKVERRCLAVTVFVGERLDYHDVRHLSSQPGKAEASAIGFLTWVLDHFEVDAAALEQMTNGDDIRRAVLNKAVLDELRATATPVWQVTRRELYEAYGFPPLNAREPLRQGAQTILWSMFHTDAPHPHELDAAALGLYIQIERQFYQP